MEAEYVGFYLGATALTKATTGTGLGVIQKPLREKYFAYRKSADNKLGPEIGIRVNPRGLILLFPGGHPGEPNDEFYEISSIHSIEAVRFVIRKQKDKKFYGAFLPVDDVENPSFDKLFVQIDKKFNHLSKMSHPPMLACVMRRSTGIKAVDCHMFVIPVTEDALRIADMVHRFQERPDHPEFYYGGRPPPERRDLPPEPDVIPRNLSSSSRDRNSGAGTRESDDYAYLYKGRGFELRQEHFRGGEDEIRLQEQPPDRSFERERLPLPSQEPPGFDPMRGRPGSHEIRGGPREIDRDSYPDRRPRELRKSDGRFIERDSFGGEHEFDNVIRHERQRSGGEHFTGDRRFVSPRDDYPRFPRNDFPPPDRHDFPPRREPSDRRPDNYPGRLSDSFDQPRGPPPWQDRRSTGEDPRVYRDYDEPPFPRPYRGDQPRSPPLSGRGRASPRSKSPPRGPPSPRGRSPENDQIYSASNIESRLEEQQAGKPVAKVPPNRHVGVRVLPTLPIGDAKHMLKPVSPRNSDPPAKIEDKPPTYTVTKPEPDEESPYDNAPDKYIRRNRPQSDTSPLVQRRTEGQGLGPRVKSDDYGEQSYADNYGYQSNYKQWSYEDEKEKFLKSRDISGSKLGNGSKPNSAREGYNGPEYGQDLNERGGRHMKDMEIEHMFSKLRTSNQQVPGGADFERGLGYLP